MGARELQVSNLGRQEADEQVEQVNSETVGDDEPAVDKVHADQVHDHQDAKSGPSGVQVHGRFVQVVLPLPAPHPRSEHGGDDNNNQHLESWARTRSGNALSSEIGSSI